MKMYKIENACAFIYQTDSNRELAYAMEGYLSGCGVSCVLLDRAAMQLRTMEVYVQQQKVDRKVLVYLYASNGTRPIDIVEAVTLTSAAFLPLITGETTEGAISEFVLEQMMEKVRACLK